MSPFAKNARAAGMSGVRGGKVDDITVLLATVKVHKMRLDDNNNDEAAKDGDASGANSRAQA